jgi:hypothetical protein
MQDGMIQGSILNLNFQMELIQCQKEWQAVEFVRIMVFRRSREFVRWVVYAFIAWSLAWKAVALWKSARLSHKVWFGIMLVANTVGILEIIYIFAIARKYTVETKTDGATTAGGSSL